MSRARAALAALLALAVAAPAAASAASPSIWAHRGASYVNGKATYPENTLPAFEHAAKQGFTLELDLHFSKDHKLFVIHDPTLDRTTPCKGKVTDVTYAFIASKCKSDILGSPGGPLDTAARKTKPTVPLPTFVQVLKLALKYKVPIAPELKELDSSGATARALAAQVKAAKFPQKLVTVQSFYPPNLNAIEPLLPDAKISQLSLKVSQSSSIALAKGVNADIVSPEFPVDAAYVEDAHAAHLKVAAYTLDKASQIRAAMAAGVDSVITDDATMAAKALGLKLKTVK